MRRAGGQPRLRPEQATPARPRIGLPVRRRRTSSAPARSTRSSPRPRPWRRAAASTTPSPTPSHLRLEGVHRRRRRAARAPASRRGDTAGTACRTPATATRRQMTLQDGARRPRRTPASSSSRSGSAWTRSWTWPAGSACARPWRTNMAGNPPDPQREGHELQLQPEPSSSGASQATPGNASFTPRPGPLSARWSWPTSAPRS